MSLPRFLSIPLVAVLAVSCATNPATGKRELSLIGEGQEVELGKSAASEVSATLGLYHDDSLQAYVDQVGQRLAAASERPKLDWSFKVVDDPGVNAFALPGGYIYVTRGLLAHSRSEAEMAAVLGHEIGHVTARHSVSQISKAQLAQIGLGVGMILKPSLQPYGQIGQAGLSLLMLKYGRDDENEADDLGLRYSTRVGYPPEAMPEVLRMLDRVSGQVKTGRVPTWLSTHPSPGSRLARIGPKLKQLEPEESLGERQDAFLRHVDGLVYGPDPREGFVHRGTFYHPSMAFEMDFPDDFVVSNTKQAVGAISARRDAVVVLTLARRPSAQAAAREFFSQSGVQEGRAWRSNIGGSDTVAREFGATTESMSLRGVAAFVEHDNRVFQLLAYTPEQLWSRYDNVLADSIESFRRLTERRYLNVQPMRIQVVSAPRGMTIAEVAERYRSLVDVEDLALLNGVTTRSTLEPGQRVKVVVGDTLSREILREQERREQ
jgi:predicted Zn-dependent protease